MADRDPMTEERIREIVDLRSEVTIEFTELLRAVSCMRGLLLGIGINMGQDCDVCLRSLAEHDNDVRNSMKHTHKDR